MNLVADQGAQAFVDELMARQLALVFEFCGDNQGLEMRVVVAEDFDRRIVESGLDQAADFRWVHFDQMLR